MKLNVKAPFYINPCGNFITISAPILCGPKDKHPEQIDEAPSLDGTIE
jgi:hypothetical protein